MNDIDIEKYRTTLEAAKAELEGLAETSQAAGKPVALDQASVGRLSRMDAMQAQQMALEAERRRQQQLVRIEGALRRIASGDYGFCYVCHEQMDERRLQADPTVTRCLKCAAG